MNNKSSYRSYIDRHTYRQKRKSCIHKLILLIDMSIPDNFIKCNSFHWCRYSSIFSATYTATATYTYTIISRRCTVVVTISTISQRLC